jgi:DNA primase
MARFDDGELEELKRKTDLAALIRSRGVELRGSDNGNLVGRCPFHDDDKPSFVVTPGKGLWRCMSPACAATGNAIQFIMRKDRLSFRHAVELLRAPSAAAFTTTARTVPKLSPPVALDADDQTLLRQVVDYYAERLKDPAAGAPARRYLDKRGIGSVETIAAHKLGYADRTLGLRLPHNNRKEGAAIRARLQRLGIIRESGHEHFNGCLVVPILDAGGAVVGLYGRKLLDNLTPGLARHLYLPGPHRGPWNPAALASREVILCEALFDALTFWENGHRNVTTAYGVEGFTEEMENAFVAARVAVVYLAFDRDEAGEIGAGKVAARLMARGIECRRVLFPHGQDANDYARKTQPAGKALGVLLNAAEWLGKGRAVPGFAAQKSEVSADAAASPSPVAPPAPASSSLAAKAAKAAASPGASWSASQGALNEPEREEKRPGAPSASQGTAPPVPPADRVAAKEKTSADNVAASGSPTPAASAPSLIQRGEHWFFDLADPPREYRVGGLEKTLGTDALKVSLRLRVGDRFHLDALDLARDGERRRFVERAAEETGLHVDLLRRDVARLLLAVETAQAELARPAEEVAPAVVLTPEERAAALAWAQAPDLVGRLRAALRRVLVGEDANALVLYLVGTSRLLDRPLAGIVQSPSAAGKTTLMDAALSFFPEEDRVKYSAMTGQSLFYMGDADLKHKILAIVEEAGAEKASYALKLLQSEGELTIASTGKNPATGRMETQEYHVEGPVAILLTTTSADLDEELQNRCLTLAVDDSPEQTARIHALQRERRTLAGLVGKAERAAVLGLLRNVQRLLKPLDVLNPYAPALTFTSGRARNRRDHEKYLTLIDAIALLHQHQRPRGRHEVALPGGGVRVVEYVAVTLDDIALANELAPEVLGRSLDELPPQTRRLLDHIKALVKAKLTATPGQSAKLAATFARRELREACGWSLTQVRVHLERLVELEYLELRHGKLGGGFVYELMIDAHAPAHVAHIGLIDVEDLKKKYGYSEGVAGFVPGVAGQNGEVAGGDKAPPPAPKPDADRGETAA